MTNSLHELCDHIAREVDCSNIIMCITFMPSAPKKQKSIYKNLANK